MPTGAALAAASVIGAVTSRSAAKSAGRAQDQASRRATEQTKTSATQARKDVNRLFSSANKSAQGGFQDALDVYSQSAPAQASLFQQGNVGAQNAILAGLPQMQNAILGGNVDLSQLQAFEVEQPDLSFLNQNTGYTKQINENEAMMQRQADELAARTPAQQQAIDLSQQNVLAGQQAQFSKDNSRGLFGYGNNGMHEYYRRFGNANQTGG